MEVAENVHDSMVVEQGHAGVYKCSHMNVNLGNLNFGYMVNGLPNDPSVFSNLLTFAFDNFFFTIPKVSAGKGRLSSYQCFAKP